MRFKPWWPLAAAALALFIGLGGRALWEDEAETALLARQVLAHGLPYAGGGTVISQLHQMELGWDGLWTWTPWAQVYIAALSLKLFGQTAWGARVLFAALGLAGLWAFTLMARDFFGQDGRCADLALFFGSSCVPLLLHFRQCRWYAPAFLEFVLWWWGYWKTIEGKRGGGPLLAAGMAGLFYTQQLTFAAAALSFLITHLVFFRSKTRLLVRPVAAAALCCAPWLLLQAHFTTPAFPVGPWDRFMYYVSELNAHHLPLVLFLPWLALNRGRGPRAAFGPCFLAAYLAVLSLGPFPNFYRYLIPVLPVVLLLQAAVGADIARKLPGAVYGWLFMGVFAGTNLFHMALPALLRAEGPAGHATVQCPWAGYLEELVLDFNGPISAAARYLNAHAAPGDAVWIGYGDLPLRFHTRLAVYGGLTGVPFASLPRPDWVVLRSQMLAGPRGWDRMLALHVAKTLDIKDYRRIELDAPDIPWENRPEPDEHFFTTPSGYPPMTLFQRR